MREISQYKELQLKLEEKGFKVDGDELDFKVVKGSTTYLQVRLESTEDKVNIPLEFHTLNVDLKMELMLNMSTYIVLSR